MSIVFGARVDREMQKMTGRKATTLVEEDCDRLQMVYLLHYVDNYFSFARIGSFLTGKLYTWFWRGASSTTIAIAGWLVNLAINDSKISKYFRTTIV